MRWRRCIGGRRVTSHMLFPFRYKATAVIFFHRSLFEFLKLSPFSPDIMSSSRVKQAILKKEDVVKQIQEQHQAAVKRADHLEGLLEQQRKQLLRK